MSQRTDVTTEEVPSQSPAQRGDVRRRILVEAARTFSQSGVAPTSMQKIADKVGVTKPAIYYHFPSKQHLHYEIHAHALDEALDDLRAIRDRDEPAASRLQAVVALILASIADRRDVYTILLREANLLAPEHWITIKEKGDEYRRLVEEIIAEGQAAGEFEVRDPSTVTLALLGMCNWAYTWLDPAGPLTTDEIGRRFTDILLHGIATTCASHDAR
jgi:AcrR family transcriptional regulator